MNEKYAAADDNNGMQPQRGLERLVDLSDAVVAIAATLLVLPLVEIAGPDSGSSTWEVITSHRVDLFAFVLSFAVIFVLWMTHHRVFRDVTGYTTNLALANFFWLLSIVFLPFPTKLIAEKNGFDAGATATYVGTIALSMMAIFALQVVIAHTPGITRLVPEHGRRTATIGVVLVLIAFGLAFTPVGLWSLTVLALTASIDRFFDRRTAKAEE